MRLRECLSKVVGSIGFATSYFIILKKIFKNLFEKVLTSFLTRFMI